MNINMVWLLNITYFMTNFLVALGFILKGQSHQIANPAATSFFYLGIVLFEHYSSFKLKNYIRILLILTLTSHSLFGEYFQAYYKTAFFDNALHFLGSFSFGIFAFELLVFFTKVQVSRILTFILVSLLGISLGTFFELMEFSLDILLKENNQFGLYDTDLDLTFDVLGSLFAGIFLVIMNYEPSSDNP